jgi:lysine-N-methylase
MNEIRIFCLQLIRTEGLELWQRLAVAGVFCQNLTETFADGGHAEVPSMVESFRAMVQNGQLADTLVDLKPDYPLQASFFGTLVLGRGIRDLSVFQGKVRQAIGAGLGISEEIGGLGAEQLVENYVRGVARLPDALQVAPRLLEHYLLNEMFSEMFPFKGASAYEHYRDIVSRFGLLRLMLAAQCNTNGSLPDAATLVQTVEVFCRLYQHDSAFSSMVNSIHKSSGSDKLERVFRFLRT